MNLINFVGALRYQFDMMDHKWFLCFGTLLHFLRHDHEFNFKSDIDVGIIDDDGGVNLTGCVPIVRGQRGIIWEASLPVGGIDVDVFIWRRRGGYYYHCYDEQHERPANGMLSSYAYKGIPTSCFDPTQKEIQFYRGHPIWANMTKFGTWLHTVKGCEAESLQLPVPFNYGQCLDWWYPDWGIKRENFGVSKSAHMIKGKW